MSFIEGFYSFNIQLNDTAHNHYEQLRLKIARHQNDSMTWLYARLLAYLHGYREGLILSQDRSNQKLPSIFRKDVLGEIDIWIEIGKPDKDKLIRALRNYKDAAFSVYFFDQGNLNAFCHDLRGSKTNWVARVNFFQINPEFLERISKIKKSSSNWTVTLLDSIIYLSIDDQNFEGNIESIDIWKEYQDSLIAVS